MYKKNIIKKLLHLLTHNNKTHLNFIKKRKNNNNTVVVYNLKSLM